MRQSFWKKVLAAWLSFLLIFMASLVPGLDGTAAEGAVTVSAPSAILLEAQTGTVIFEKDADRICSPASITKIMTLLLIFEALGQGQIHLTDEVVTSEHAQSMGGSQVFLEAGEVQTVETLIKCIAVASGNDAAVAMAEYICGSEEAFVTKMNEKAQSLGMTNTHFTDCCGLTDDDSHHTTARDVAIMSRELVQKYPRHLSVYRNLDGGYYPYDGAGQHAVYTFVHQQAAKAVPVGDGAENRFNSEGEILSVCNCQKRRDRPDYGRDDCTGFQGTFSGCGNTAFLRLQRQRPVPGR